ncbi:MAG: arsenate reductase [Acidimicrobiia bacterium]|nr:arsenate reductase [Acidimicrobiia bacterium]MYC57980.1 arsenate reductase [Acidimicrobiia bacterium]MYI31071.1 arsenate reductase [Acidimicrobiia bacterium]
MEFDVVHYLKTPLSQQELERLLEILESAPSNLVRQDSYFKKLDLNIEDYQNSSEVVQLLLKHPKLMQRPVAVRGNKAIISRPPKKIMELLQV